MKGDELRQAGARIAEALHERYPMCTEREFLAALASRRSLIYATAQHSDYPDVRAAIDEIETAAPARWRELRQQEGTLPEATR